MKHDFTNANGVYPGTNIQYLPFDSPQTPRVAPEVLDRVRTELAFAEQRKYLAVAIDIADLKALLAAVGGTP